MRQEIEKEQSKQERKWVNEANKPNKKEENIKERKYEQKERAKRIRTMKKTIPRKAKKPVIFLSVITNQSFQKISNR